MRKNIPLHSHRALRNATATKQQVSMEPGNLIRLVRERLHMNQRQLARRSRIPQSHLAHIEQGKGDVQYGSLTRILKALFCQPVLTIQPENDFEAIIEDRVREVAGRKVRRTLGTMAMESQEPDNETSKELLRREVQRLLKDPSSEIWDDETV
jgi:transcriptional regulator with XRE-family HTH domain